MEDARYMLQAARLDITQTPGGDIGLATGDLTYTESTGQHQRDILLADKGHFKEAPAVGVGSINFINDTLNLVTIYNLTVNITGFR